MRDIIEAWQGKRALVVGDPLIDRYHFGKVERISQEAPVPIFVTEKTEERRGGADNVAANLEALGMEVHTHYPNRPWGIKIRYISGHHQLFRVDEDVKHLPGPPILVTKGWAQVIVISDYAKGYCSRDVCQTLIEHADCPVVVDPKGIDWGKYKGATVCCPNEHERNNAWGIGRPNLIKRGARGIDLEREDEYLNFPAQAHRIYDVTGCGDVVTAVVAATLAAGGSLEIAAQLANLAAGWAAGEIGTVACSKEQLCELVSRMESSTSSMRGTNISSQSAANIATISSSQSILTNTQNALKGLYDPSINLAQESAMSVLSQKR